jgi:hypothetical protein
MVSILGLLRVSSDQEKMDNKIWDQIVWKVMYILIRTFFEDDSRYSQVPAERSLFPTFSAAESA